jgi:hypothetical protein
MESLTLRQGDYGGRNLPSDVTDEASGVPNACFGRWNGGFDMAEAFSDSQNGNFHALNGNSAVTYIVSGSQDENFDRRNEGGDARNVDFQGFQEGFIISEGDFQLVEDEFLPACSISTGWNHNPHS